METKTFNLFAKLRENIEDYYYNGIFLVGKPSAKDKIATNSEDRGHDGGYYYSQRLTLEAIDLACASKFKKGDRDKEGKQKIYLNTVNFHADVAINQTGVNTSNYIMEPDNSDDEWPVFFMDKKFKEFSDEKSYDDIIDELADDYCRKGSCVSKRVKGSVERVPLRTIRNSIGAKTLEDASRSGGYAIIENEMHYSKMKKYPKWKLDGLDKTKSYNVFEKYALIPRAVLNNFKGTKNTEVDWEDYICCQQILIPNSDTFKVKNVEEAGGHTCFIEEVPEGEFPLDEAHYKKIDGRWLGEGEVEKQLQNQIARNFTANLRRRSLLWATKKLFTSTDDEVAKNLLMEAQDGAVIKIKPNGQLSPVNTQTQHLADFNADENSVKENAQQISFSFESATGESMPSATPFRLGVILENAVSKYFKRKQDTFSNYLKRSFFNQLVPIFQQEIKEEHRLRYSIADDQYEQALKGMIRVHSNKILKAEWLKGNQISADKVQTKVEEELRKSPYIFWDIPSDWYKNINTHMRLNINEPISADVETLTNIWDRLDQRGDPRAENVLRAVLAKKGKNLDAIIGSISAPKAPQNPQMSPMGKDMMPKGAINIPNKEVPA